MVDVEQRALRAFEQDALALAALLVEQRPHRIHVGQHLRRDRCELVVDRARRDLVHAEPAAQRVVMRQQPLDLAVRASAGRRGPSGGSRGGRPCPHRPGRCRAWWCRSRALPEALSRIDVELLVQRQDQRDVLGDAQVVRRDRDALPLEPVDLLEQRAADRAPRRCRSPTACPAAPRRTAAATACR